MVNTFTDRVFWTLLIAIGIIAAARWLHPATFSVQTFLVVTVITFIVGVLYLKKSS
ncbi:MAG: hypothetical protein WD200_03745 [Candidatus Andersenbacteria bacterium]